MRWLVEVSSLGKTDMQKFCVEAESWQRALQAARAERGEEGPMSGFSIELLEEGYRAVDPLARVRFVVKRAPDDMPITVGKEAGAKSTSKTGVAPAKPSTAPPAMTAANAGPTEPKLPAAPVSSSPAVGAKGGNKSKSIPPRPALDKQSAISAMTAAALAPQAARAEKLDGPAVPAAPSSSNVTSTTQQTPDAKKKAQTIAFGSGGEVMTEAKSAVAERPPTPAIGSQMPGLPATKLLSSREQDPTDASPLTYREYAFAVPAGTTEEVAADVLRAQLRLVDAAMGGAVKMGKLVNLAAFDVEFKGKPPKPPLATLTWKDWKGDPVIAFPRKGGGQKPVVRPPSKAPPAPAPTQPTTAPVIPQAAPVPTNTVVQGSNATTGPTTAPIIPAAAPVAAPAFPAPATASAAPASQAPVHVHVHTPVQPVMAAAAVAQVVQPQVVVPASVPPPAPVAQVAPPPPPPVPPPPATAPLVSPPGGTPHITEGEANVRPRAPSSPEGMVRTPSGRFVRGRVTGDELITSLFESMHDLHFLRDALDGGQFCLALATEVLPARAAIIHFFDVEKREWVVACTRGKDTQKLLNMRAPESDEMLRNAARKRRAIVAANAAQHATGPRYQALGGGKSLIIAPIMQAGRALGAIEIINPLDGMPFTEDEGNAMTYIAEQYAEYLGSRGIITDKDRIQSAAAAR